MNYECNQCAVETYCRVGNSLIGVLNDSLIFCELMSGSLVKKSKYSSFSRCFVIIELSKSLTVALL